MAYRILLCLNLKLTFFLEVLGVDFSNKSRNLQIGSYLQTLRQEQELTLEQLSVLSQVPVVHLTSIEEGRFSRFDEFYLKLYLKRFTGSLDVDLEQLYTYATQQPLPDDLSESEKSSSEQDERQMTKMQANISATPKSVVNANPQRNPNLKVANIASLENKKRIIKLVTGLVLIIILILIVVFIVTFIQDLADGDPTDDDTLPTIVENPHDINGDDEDNDSNDIDEEDIDDEDNDQEEEPEPDPEPNPADMTSIEMENHVGTVQTFIVETEHDEIQLRVEHSGDNWIGYPLYDITSDTFEHIMEPDANGNVVLSVGAVHNVEAIFINDVEVEFESSVPPGLQDFIFVIEFE